MKKLFLILAMVLLASPVWAVDYFAVYAYPYLPDTRIPGSFIVNVNGVDQSPVPYATQVIGGVAYAITLDTTSLPAGQHTFTARACLGPNGMDIANYGSHGGCSGPSIPYIWTKVIPVVVPISPKGSTVITIIVTPK